jgi:hypothetical protein
MTISRDQITKKMKVIFACRLGRKNLKHWSYEQQIFFQAMLGRPPVAKRIGGCSKEVLLRGCGLGNSFISLLQNGLNLITVVRSTASHLLI